LSYLPDLVVYSGKVGNETENTVSIVSKSTRFSRAKTKESKHFPSLLLQEIILQSVEIIQIKEAVGLSAGSNRL
jgi:hypothetical protein